MSVYMPGKKSDKPNKPNKKPMPDKTKTPNKPNKTDKSKKQNMPNKTKKPDLIEYDRFPLLKQPTFVQKG